MALIFFEGFDAYSAVAQAVSGKWNSNTGTAQSFPSGRTGNCLRFTGTGQLVKTFGTTYATAFIGFAFRASSIGTVANILYFYDNATQQCEFVMNVDGTLAIKRAGTALTGGTSTFSVAINIWYYIEIKITISNSISAGDVSVRVNGTEVLSVSAGQGTRAGTNNYFGKIQIGSGSSVSGNIDIDDFYFLDTTGSSPNNTFLGDSKVVTIYPNGAGNSTQWTASAGSNYQCVDETGGHNTDTDYVSTSTATNIDTYAMTDPTGLGTIFGVQLNIVNRKDDAGVRTIAATIRTGSTNYFGANYGVGDTYTFNNVIWENNPNTSAAWTSTDLTGVECGVKLVA